MSRLRIGLSMVLAFAATGMVTPAGSAASAATASSQPEVGDMRLNGFWNIDEAARRATLANLRAELTPAAQAVAERGRIAQQARLARNEVVSIGSATCAYNGLPFMVNISEPFLMIARPDKAVQYFERYQISTREYYMDGRTLDDVAKLPYSTNGYSVGRWEGKTLVIQTRGLPRGGTQGGGMKGPNTLLTERVSLSPDGNRLEWNYHWEDAELLAKPYSYSIMYDRAPKHTYALREACDPNENPGYTVDSSESPEAK